MMMFLDTTYGWRGRIYRYGNREIPQDLAIVLGGTESSETETETESETTETTEETTETVPEETPEVAETVEGAEALTLINGATTASSLTVLPGIGNAGAGHLLTNRPTAGYLTFAALKTLNVVLSVTPFSVDWDLIAAWEPSA